MLVMETCSFLRCCLCRGCYVDPRILDCYHTFCLLCLNQHFHTKAKGRNTASHKLKCPICAVTVRLNEDGINGLKANVYISELIRYDSIHSEQKVSKHAFCHDDINFFASQILEEIDQEEHWALQTLDGIQLALDCLKISAVTEEEKIKMTAQEFGASKNLEDLLQEVKNIIVNEEDVAEAWRTRLAIFLLGLQHHRVKVLDDKRNNNYREDALSDCRCFLNSCREFKVVSRMVNPGKMEFTKFLVGSRSLGKIRFVRENEGGADLEISPDGLIRISSITKFDKKLRSAAYCEKTSEVFLVFGSSKTVLVLREELIDSSIAATESRVEEGDHKLVAIDGKQRKIVVNNLDDANDLVVCQNFLFISERSKEWIHKIPILSEDLDGVNGRQEPSSSRSGWETGSYNNGLSKTRFGTLLVACNSTRRITEYSVDGYRMRTINLAQNLTNPRHALILPEWFMPVDHHLATEPLNVVPDYFAVCLAGAKHEVVIINAAGKVLSRYPTDADKLNYPVCLALVRNASDDPRLLVCDRLNRRLLSLDRELVFVRTLAPTTADNLSGTSIPNDCNVECTCTTFSISEGKEKLYKMQCPAKILAAGDGTMFLVDEDNASLVKLKCL